MFCYWNALQRTSTTPTAQKEQSKRRSALNPFTSWQTMTHYRTNINRECAVCEQWSPVWIKNICPCFMALERIIRASQQSPKSNLYSSSPEVKHTGVTTALVINCRRHLCVTYLSLSALLFSISSMAHLQLSQQATEEDGSGQKLLFKYSLSRLIVLRFLTERRHRRSKGVRVRFALE